MIYIIIEDVYRNTTWCNNLLNGILFGLNKNHLKYSIHLNADTVKPKPGSFSIILFANFKWANSIILKLDEKKIPILIFSSYYNTHTIVNKLYFDFELAAYQLREYMQSINKNSTALFAVNERSPSNILIKNGFLEFFDNSNEQDIYTLSTSISASFEEIYEKIDLYDSIICTNAHTAVFLINKLREYNYPIERIKFVSFGESILLFKTISNAVIVSQPHQNAGKMAISLIKMLTNHPEISHMSSAIKCDIYEQKYMPSSSDDYDIIKFKASIIENTTNTYENENEELSEIMRIENLLDSSSQIELKIIDLLLTDHTYEETAVMLSLSVNTIKYHMKKLLLKINCSSKNEFKKLFLKYNYGQQN